MTDYPAAIPLLAIQRLRCAKCGTRMMLASTLPGPTGFDVRTFDCSKCGRVEKIVIALDPMKSGAVGWFAGELQTPAQAMPPSDTVTKPGSKTLNRVLSLIAAFIVVAIIIVARY
jgi:hypothetical protein